VKRLLSLNDPQHNDEPVEVILLSRNDPDTGNRVLKTIKSYGLSITRAVFVSGRESYRYIDAFNGSLFLSANSWDVEEAIRSGYPAGRVLHSTCADDDQDRQLRVAFDFDGVLIDDAAERIYQLDGLAAFHKAESELALQPHASGPLKRLFDELAKLQKRELRRSELDKTYKPRIRTAIVTARNAPAHERLVTTLRNWGIQPDETFLLGGMDKSRILRVLKPHLFFDDQMTHLHGAAGVVPSVHVPFGISNKRPILEQAVVVKLSSAEDLNRSSGVPVPVGSGVI
jgi:5'-nucleotidase